MQTSETIKKIRLALCLSQKELGELVGVHLSTICNYENGYRLPSKLVIRKLLALAIKNKMKLKVEDFLGE